MEPRKIADLPDFVLQDFQQLYETMGDLFYERRFDVILNVLSLHSAHILVERDSTEEEIEGFLQSVRNHIATIKRVYDRPDNAQ